MRRKTTALLVVIALAFVAFLARDARTAATLTAQDYAEIHQLYARYNYGVDAQADDGWLYARAFTEDGEFVESNAAEPEVDPTPVHDEADHQEHAPQPIATSVAADGEFSITIAGPGLNSTLVIREPEDLLIVDAMLKKVERKLEAVGDAASFTPSDSLGRPSTDGSEL